MFKNSLGKKTHIDFPLGVQVFSSEAATSLTQEVVSQRAANGLGLVMRSYLKKGYNFVTCLLSSLCPLVWNQHDPKMSGGVW